MEIKKKAKSFNEYVVELSWGQLEAIKSALEKDHADPLSDELFQGLVWYMNGNLPTPGEDDSKDKDKDGGEGDELLDAPPADEPTVRPGGPQGTDQNDDGSGAPLGEPDGTEGPAGSDDGGEGDDLLPAPPEEE